ncbi:MAG: holo-ACP synthase [Oscillospiraceae bacterium]|nr:holo-ACP synthase [Oscillospiraceae bacterium]MBQ7816302.1 holo-ACP synthase [Oscillospiraceae bacterium]
MYGIGVDIVSIDRIEKSLEKQSFLKRVFGAGEIALFVTENKIKTNSLAANFAAKEAFSKALGTGVRGFDFDEVQILRDSLGAPYFEFCGRAKEIVQSKNLSCKVSLSHEKDKAIAFVVIEQK